MSRGGRVDRIAEPVRLVVSTSAQVAKRDFAFREGKVGKIGYRGRNDLPLITRLNAVIDAPAGSHNLEGVMNRWAVMFAVAEWRSFSLPRWLGLTEDFAANVKMDFGDRKSSSGAEHPVVSMKSEYPFPPRPPKLIPFGDLPYTDP